VYVLIDHIIPAKRLATSPESHALLITYLRGQWHSVKFHAHTAYPMLFICGIPQGAVPGPYYLFLFVILTISIITTSFSSSKNNLAWIETYIYKYYHLVLSLYHCMYVHSGSIKSKPNCLCHIYFKPDHTKTFQIFREFNPQYDSNTP